jgi:hypothetical protein
MPQPEVSIPGDVPAALGLTDKEGNKATGNGREMYAAAFREGWAEYWKLYQRGEVSLADEFAEPTLVQEYNIEARGRADGFRQCRQMILKQRAAAVGK